MVSKTHLLKNRPFIGRFFIWAVRPRAKWDQRPLLLKRVLFKL